MKRKQKEKRQVFAAWNTLQKSSKFRENKLKKKVFRRWMESVAEKERTYFWTKSIVIGLVDDVLDRKTAEIEIRDVLNGIEIKLKSMLADKMRFRSNCKKYLNMRMAVGNRCGDEDYNKMETSLRTEIETYLQKKVKRKEEMTFIVRDINRIHPYFVKTEPQSSKVI